MLRKGVHLARPCWSPVVCGWPCLTVQLGKGCRNSYLAGPPLRKTRANRCLQLSCGFQGSPLRCILARGTYFTPTVPRLSSAFPSPAGRWRARTHPPRDEPWETHSVHTDQLRGAWSQHSHLCCDLSARSWAWRPRLQVV